MIKFSLLFLVLCYAPSILYAQKEDSSANIIMDIGLVGFMQQGQT